MPPREQIAEDLYTGLILIWRGEFGMAFGKSGIFSWKSKEEQKREQDEYAAWAFPYGQNQRDILEALLRGVFPKINIQIALISFLTCKELYEKALKRSGSRDEAKAELFNKQSSYKNIIKKKDMPMYVALVLADEEIDEQCVYPTADVILTNARELEGLHKGR